MEGSLTGSPRRRRFSKPASSAEGLLAWLQRNPMAAAAVYMLLGGGIVYFFLGTGYQRQQQHDGVVRLGTIPHLRVNPAPPAPATFRVAQAAVKDVMCADTCFKANDGDCDDGRFLHNMTRGLASHVLCDLGTDCSDCGPWRGVQHSSSWKEAVGPVEYLRRHNLTVLTKKSALEPRFHFAFTDPEHDIDASKDFAGFSTLELRLSHIAYHVLHGACQQGAAVGGHSSSIVTDTSTADEDSAGQTQQQQQEDASEGAAGVGGKQQYEASSEGLMLDVGAGFGWYSLLAGMLGCRVIAWEPVKIFQAYMEYSIARNKLQHKVEVRAAAVVAPSGSSVTVSTSSARVFQQQHAQQRKLTGRQQPAQQLQQQAQLPQAVPANVTVVAPTRGMWGTASIAGASIHMALSAAGIFHKYDVPAETIDSVILPLLSTQQQNKRQSLQQQQQQSRRHSHVALLKVDIEGQEPEALAGAAQLLSGGLLDNVLLEYAPHVAEAQNITQVSKYPHMLLQLLKAGYHLGHVPNMDYAARMLTTYSEPLHQLQAVTEDNLKFDLFDCMQMTEVGWTWLHEPCREMLSYGLISEGIPERLHPKSFRSTFELNTHVWATRQQRYTPYVKGPPVGVFAPDRKLTDSWFVKESSALDRGMGGRSCKNLREVAASDELSSGATAAFLISHRCRCALVDSLCAEEEALADSCARSGRTPFRDEPVYVPE